MKKGDVITVITMVGEFVGKFDTSGGGTVTMEDPRMLIQTEQGMGFARGICVTGEEDPKSVTFAQYVFVTPSNEDIEKAYRQATSGLII